MFQLHAKLAEDCFCVGSLPLSKLLLMNDSRYPWFILVPAREGIREIYQLSAADQQQLMQESNGLSSLLARHFDAHKMNVAALGNMVPQLHIHHIVRFRDDAAWPQPVWGVHPAIHYENQTLLEMLEGLKPALRELDCELDC